MKETSEILEKCYNAALKNAQMQSSYRFSKDFSKLIDLFVENIESDKSLIQLIVTTLLKKISSPQHDIRLHMAKFPNGYSARVLDTQVTTPFFKKHFPKYANKETAFLTKATRSEIKWDFEEGIKLPFRSKSLINPFLELIDLIQHEKINNQKCLIYIFVKLIKLNELNIDSTVKIIDSKNIKDTLNINIVVKMLEKHFNTKLSSRLPVIAIFAAYKQLFGSFKRYKNKMLMPLNVHTSSDKHYFGDIEIRNNDDTPFEIVEIKHNISIDRNLVLDVVKKSENSSIERYYILTTYKGSFKNTEEEDYINNLILNVKKQRNIEIIPNGIIPSIKYYLRFIDDYHEFIRCYTKSLVDDYNSSTEIKNIHLTKWQEILDDYSSQDSSL